MVRCTLISAKVIVYNYMVVFLFEDNIKINSSTTGVYFWCAVWLRLADRLSVSLRRILFFEFFTFTPGALAGFGESTCNEHADVLNKQYVRSW